MIEKLNQIADFFVDWIGEIVGILCLLFFIYVFKEMALLFTICMVVGVLMDANDDNIRLIGFATFLLLIIVLIWAKAPPEVIAIFLALPVGLGYFVV